jgi:hypothetical protein
MSGALLGGIAGCADKAVDTTTNPPFASPALSPPAAIASRSCEAVKAGSAASGIEAAKVLIIRQGANLQRVGDTLSGSVPGGDFKVDAGLADRNSKDLLDILATSNLCEPTKSALVAKAQALVDADQALVATGGGAGAPEALQASLAAYKDLGDLVQNPPTS